MSVIYMKHLPATGADNMSVGRTVLKCHVLWVICFISGAIQAGVAPNVYWCDINAEYCLSSPGPVWEHSVGVGNAVCGSSVQPGLPCFTPPVYVEPHPDFPEDIYLGFATDNRFDPPWVGRNAPSWRVQALAICPVGYHGPYINICYRLGVPEEDKNLGEQCPVEGFSSDQPMNIRSPLDVGNPISVGIGNKHQTEVDYLAAGINPLSFVRYYNSVQSLQSWFKSPSQFGQRWRVASAGTSRWRSTYDRSIFLTEFKGITTATAYRHDGKAFYFTLSNGKWVPDADVHYALIRLLDADGSPAGWQLVTPDDTKETYDGDGRLAVITDLNGVNQLLTYSQQAPGMLERVDAATGNYLTFEYDENNRLIYVRDDSSPVRTWGYRYDTNNNLEYVDYPDGTSRHYHYANTGFPHALTAIDDERGIRYSNFEYSASILPHNDDGEAVASYLGPETGVLADRIGGVTISYDHYAYQRTVTNSQNRSSTYRIGNSLGVALVTEVNGVGCSGCGTGDTVYTYDAANNITSKSSSGIMTEYGGHDASGNPGYRIEAKGTTQERRTDYTYDPRFTGRVATIAEPSVFQGSVKVTTYTYDDSGNRTAEVVEGFRPDGSAVLQATTRTYDGPFRQLSQVDGPRTDISDVTTFRYYPDDPAEGNNRARLKEVENAVGILVRQNIRYTSTGKVLSESRPNGLILDYSYYPGNDRLDTLTESGATSSRTTRWTYLDTGEVESITAAAGTADATTVTFGYDAARRLVRVTDGSNSYIEYTLDTEGNRLAEQTRDSSGTLYRSLSQTFDAYNRLDLGRTGTDPDNPLEQVDADYAPDGSLDKSTDGNGVITGYGYDALRRLLTITRDLDGTEPSTANALTQYAYDVADRLTTVTDPGAGATTYRYDDLGNLLATTSPDTGVTTYSYDAAGNVLRKTLASGTPESVTLTYSYDALNRLTGVTTPDPQADLAYTYDSCPNGAGRLCRVTTGSATVFYSYDSFGNVTSHQGVAYTHDAANRLRTVTYPSGAVVTYSYDAAGQTSKVDLAVNDQTWSLATAIDYVPFGSIASLTYGNGRILTQSWDSAYRLTAQTVAGVLALSYPVYDRNGNLIRRDDSFASTSIFGYDPLNRLYTTSGPFGNDWRYGYDRNGNRLLGEEGSPMSLAYEAASNRLDRIGAADVILDIAGNTLASGDWTYSYTAHQRLATASDSGAPVASFAYNGLGQRVAKDRPDDSGQVFLYGTDGALLAETDQDGNVLVEYIYLNGQLLAIYLPDTDRDGQTNRAEAVLGTNPAIPDDDGDGLGNRDELLLYGTLPNNPDSDGDGVSDGAEVANGTDPADPGSVSVSGDINADGQVDAADYLLLNQFVLGIRIPAVAEQAAADLNQDGQLTAGDLMILSRILLELVWQEVIESAFSQMLLAARDDLLRQAEAAVTQGELYYVHNDHLGSPQAMTDEAGGVVWRAMYDPFGRATVSVNTVELNVRFPGQYYDRETGLHYNLNRYYDPETGRYIKSDPIGVMASLNTYVYVDNQPINWFDLYGLIKNCSYWGGTNCSEYELPVNGNFTPGYSEQDFVCSSIGALFDNSECTTQCCADHDNCYEMYQCNWSSWLMNVFGADAPCNKCNRVARRCIIRARIDCEPPFCPRNTRALRKGHRP